MKWPNDLMIGDRKCAGILSQGRSAGSTTRVIVGVGLNVNRPQSIPADIESVAAWLSDAVGGPVDRTGLLIAILRKYEATFDELVTEPKAVIQRWSARAALRGKRVNVKATDGSTMHTGEVLDVGAGGELVLKTDRGTISVLLGDVDAI